MTPADPLAKLRPLHLPEPVDWWPPAPGWWAVALLLLCVIVAVCCATHRRIRKTAFRRQASKELDTLLLDAPNQNTGAVLAKLNEILKRVALLTPSATEAAGLSGHAWLEFLDRTGGADAFRHGPGKVLNEAPYQCNPQVDLDALIRLCRQWIQRQK